MGVGRCHRHKAYLTRQFRSESKSQPCSCQLKTCVHQQGAAVGSMISSIPVPGMQVLRACSMQPCSASLQHAGQSLSCPAAGGSCCLPCLHC